MSRDAVLEAWSLALGGQVIYRRNGICSPGPRGAGSVVEETKHTHGHAS